MRPAEHLRTAGAVGLALDRDVADGLGQLGPGPLHRLADLHLLDVDVHVPVELDLDRRADPDGVGPKIPLTSGMVAISSSMGSTTSRRPSSGWLPGNGTSMSISGSLTTGMKSSGSGRRATVPSTVRLSSSISVATGRSSGKVGETHGDVPASLGRRRIRRLAGSMIAPSESSSATLARRRAEDAVEAGITTRVSNGRHGEAADDGDGQRARAARRRRRARAPSGSSASTVVAVVIRIGRRRSLPAPTIASSSASPSRRRRLIGVDQHDGVVDHDAGEHDRADQRQHADRVGR